MRIPYCNHRDKTIYIASSIYIDRFKHIPYCIYVIKSIYSHSETDTYIESGIPYVGSYTSAGLAKSLPVIFKLELFDMIDCFE